MDPLLANSEEQLIVNGKLVCARDMDRDLKPDPPLSPQRDDDEDDAATSTEDRSDVCEVSESENEADKEGMIEWFRKVCCRIF
jgi:hypothetical protein